MKQKIVRRASALVLAGCLLVGAALPALAASAKEEVIYANLDASGTVTGMYAVNSFAVQAGDTVTDHGSYTAVRNMTTTDPLEHSGDTVTAAVAEDSKLYYEGTMDTATALPWLVKLTYTLDGAEIAPEELGGKSGALAIRLQVSRNPDCTGDFFDQYALQVTMTLDTDRAQNIVADGATMANVGSNKQLSYILLPGSDSDVTVTADVTDFAMNAISLNGVKLRLNLGLDGADLTGMLDRLQSGSVQLDDGANALADGIAQVQAGLDTLNGKSGALTGGSAKVKAALTQMQTALNGVSASTDQLTTLLDASTQIQNGIAQLDAGAAQLDEQVSYDAYKAILKENGLDLDQLKDGNAKAMEQLEQLARVMPQLKDVILLLKGSSANIDAMETYLNTVHDGVAQLHAGSSTLNSQYGQFDAGVRQLANALTGMLGNLSVLTDGVNRALLPMALGGVAFGLGCAAKWTGIYAGAGLAVLYLGVLYARWQQKRPGFRAEFRTAAVGGVLFYVLLPLCLYIGSYLPYWWRNPAFSLSDWWQCQVSMFSYHATLKATHPFESRWYTWLLGLRPVWYYRNGCLPYGMKASIAGMAGPVIWLVGLAALVGLLWHQVSGRGSRQGAAVLILYGTQLIPWMLVTRCTFLYHYFPSSMFCLAALALVLARMKHVDWAKKIAAGLCVVALVLFVLYYPALSGLPIPAWWADALNVLPSFGFY